MGLAQYHLAVGDPAAARAALDHVPKETAIYLYYDALISAAAGDDERALTLGFRDSAGIEANPWPGALLG
jgi:hypothetical protein